MTLRDFIRQNRTEIDEAIRDLCPNCRLNDDERAEWVRNREDLYRWARRSGVRNP